MTPSTKAHRRPAVIATVVLILGIAASLGGNLQAINLGDAKPGAGAYISALFWPLALFLAIEIMLHTPWVNSWRDALTKWVGLVGVAGLALWISYGHLLHVLAAYGYDTVSSHVGPLAIDGLMAMATLALNRIGQARDGHVATPMTVLASAAATVASATVDTIETLATGEMPATAEPTRADDWPSLEEDRDRELAEMPPAGKAPEVPAPPAEEAPAGPVAVKLTTVPALAAKRITEALESGATAAQLTALDAALADEGLAGSARTARRWRAAVANGTARVS